MRQTPRVAVARRRGGATALLIPIVATTVVAMSGGNAVAEDGCPALYVLAIQGTGQSSDNASTTADTGMLSQVMSPLLVMAGSKVQREYVPYGAGFGGAVPGSGDPFTVSVNDAVDRAKQMAEAKLAQCKTTRLGGAGYSQGAYAWRLLLNMIAEGKSSITSDRVAAVALFGEPTRKAGSNVFANGAAGPSPVPGTDGTAVTKLGGVTAPTATGGGIGPTADTDTSLGDMAGRVASFCTTGDLACDAPTNSPLLHVVTNIAGQSKLNPNDPVEAIRTIAEAVALTSWKTLVPVINEDISSSDNTLASLSYIPKKSISQRLATASDPRTEVPSIDKTLSALFKVGTIGLNAVVTIARKVFDPVTIAAVAAAGLGNPLAAFGILAAKAGAVLIELVPPATQTRLVQQAWEAVKTNITDNSGLLDVTNLLKYSRFVEAHDSYGKTAASPTGASPVAFSADWLAAAANDIAGTGASFTPTDNNGGVYVDPNPAVASPPTPRTSMPAPTTGAETTPPDTTPTSPADAAVPTALSPTVP